MNPLATLSRCLVRCLVSLAALGLGLCAALPAQANQRHFTYTYETGVLPKGAIEIEPWTTWRFGRNEFYNRFDGRVELETGIAENLQAAWYINYGAVAQDTIVGGVRTRSTTSEFKGISSEWKWKLSDPVADVLGSALYLELTGGPTEAEVEAKVLLDKRFGNFLAAFNLVGEYEWEFAGTKGVKETVIETDAGLAYFLNHGLSVGVEARTHTEIVDGELEHTVLFAGATASYAQDKWWVAATVMPQIANFGGAHHDEAGAPHSDSNLELSEHEKVEARILFGVHL